LGLQLQGHAFGRALVILFGCAIFKFLMRPLRLLPFFLLVGAVAAHTQTYTAARVQFSDRGSFTQGQLEQAAGIHAGSTFAATELGAAAQRLVDTGYFDSMDATVDGKIGSVTVIFTDTTTPKAHMLPVRFANFVWLAHDEIEAAIRTKVPLFIDYLPENSPYQDVIKDALTQALAAKSITAKVAFDTYEPTLQHPVREVNFHIVSPAIRVANIKLGGVTAALVPLVQKSVNGAARTAYTEGPANQTTADIILAPLLDAGYVQASLTGVVATPTVAATGDVGVVLSATLSPGEVFTVSGISFAGTPVISAESFAASAKLHAGDAASHAMLLATLAPIDKAYRSKGYMDVVVNAAPTFDAAAHTVSYVVDVQPGEVYRVHEVTADNLDAAARAEFDRGFLMKAGEVYNPDYVAGFLKANTALRALEGYSAGFKAYADPNTHTVDLVITFFRGAR
jgi:outer membrane protein assembly factor BamA